MNGNWDLFKYMYFPSKPPCYSKQHALVMLGEYMILPEKTPFKYI